MTLSSRRRARSRSAEAATAARIAELTRSRRAVAEAYERERRRIERDLHDGAQQYFVAASLHLGQALLRPDADPAVATAADLIAQGLAALRHTVHGIMPRELEDLGLVAAIEDIADGLTSPVTVCCPNPLPLLDAPVLAAGYFFTAEALTNAARHAPGQPISVLVTADHALRISVVDAGPGGATLTPGGGLEGMAQRLAAFGGRLSLSSPAGGPTKVSGEIPLLLERGTSGIGGVA
ncbi:sensor histidine kinase [Corynebacterium uberis]|uniref:sensor histidine kinase n=1 Tax=Corynebacterium uberis TaxID=2883169 RepID=UPI001D0A28BB|nr:histidine kinase [Corynebacterium uberis]UDL74442.1 histidine kinase [Corynebacterium uberis]UDL83352.1 histidine kinase [Corynebacterium uberis]